MTEFEIATVLTAMLASIAYSVAFFAKEKADFDPEKFQTKKFLATLVVGIGVGISMELTGASLAFDNFESQLAAMAGTIAIVESLLKAMYRTVKQRA